jgi:exopolysaccharide biosynthesis polyprenyl glycosylphosphotransferase
MNLSNFDINALRDRRKFNRADTIPLRFQNKHEWTYFIALLVANDAVMATLAFHIAYLLRFLANISIFKLDVTPTYGHYLTFLSIQVTVWIIVFAFTGLYDRRNLLTGTREYALLFNGITLGVFIFIAVSYLIGDIQFARGWLLITWMLALFLIELGRFALRRVVILLREKGLLISRAIIVGANEESRLLAEQLIDWKYSGLFIVGFIDDQLPARTIHYKNLSILGGLEDIDVIVQNYCVQDIILSSSALTRAEVLNLFNKYGVSERVKLRLSSGLYEIITTGLQVQEFACVPLIAVNKVRLTGADRAVKAAMDYLFTAVSLVIFIPICIIIAILIKLDSKGPVFYRRRVMGVNGRQFDAFKFRTMFVNGQEILDAHPELKAELAKNYKLKDDPRVTKVGRWLRKTSLDELPQIFNILFNQMSLVGPRMISPEELGEFKQWGMNLLTIKPGMTGLWQVSGRSDVSYEERVRLDMYYIRNWSIWIDLQVLFRTIPTVLSRRGAY